MGIRSIVRRLRAAVLSIAGSPAALCSPAPARGGPPAIAVARRYFAANADIDIDPYETDFRIGNGRIAVRAWIALPEDQVSGANLARIQTTALKLRHVPPEVGRVFFLSTGYGLATADIAGHLGISRRRTTRLLLRGLAAIDGRALTKADRLRADAERGRRR